MKTQFRFAATLILYNRRAPWKNGTSRCISFCPPITQWCSISGVLFTGGRGVSDFTVWK